MVDSIAGRSLSELFKEYAEAVADLRSRLSDAPAEETDQQLLRLVLADYGKVDVAEAKARQGRLDRKKYAPVLEKAKLGQRLPQESKVREHLCFGRWHYPGAQADAKNFPPLLVTRSGLCNAQALMASVTVEEIAEYFLWERQVAFIEVCKTSQETDKLVLMVSVNDLDGASIITGREPKFFEAVKLSSETSAGLFPLLTRKHVMVNSGFLLDTLYRVVSVIMPQRVLDKVAFMSCEEFIEAFTSSGIPAASLPVFLGGSCAIPSESPLSAKA
ncbi:unnamed protein product [Polarella glacialis]|uniref:CRAL-TRIO domain-containing protein n=1 Tax=Polarella glacialis TaxID=89957 RepID=A0A813HDJ6_POLGL|nr:unnamed protein product [Polarella glacialis]|mmetsp:Transcript_46573/g.75673  ORF Transcript_46573/g.75673 Transcript_46573/m.75673 type:complete len:273 (-) Transcript_46573:275-1093(-)|eukprot:CAMPEP_0115083486 /NCGR_PEP_ID=MMETSP0227-20121206/20587_1 /TAXON_ID=89957 /ORGANISM="Polarella glacialis, Strain CCMP 1383" /LENGTH=272 /DNA_ID=CAMNT_0002471899 /DNA_START=122 /DNA_END=943 /DNA_ORIENTATION=-